MLLVSQIREYLAPGISVSAAKSIPVGNDTLRVESDLGGLVGDVQVCQGRLFIGNVCDGPRVPVLLSVAFEPIEVVKVLGYSDGVEINLVGVFGVNGLQLP